MVRAATSVIFRLEAEEDRAGNSALELNVMSLSITGKWGQITFYNVRYWPKADT